MYVKKLYGSLDKRQWGTKRGYKVEVEVWCGHKEEKFVNRFPMSDVFMLTYFMHLSHFQVLPV